MEENKSTGDSKAPFRAGGFKGSNADGIIIYNTTYQVLHIAHEAWLQWMLDISIPEILGTGCFVKHQLVRVLDTDETDGFVYALQYYAASRADYDQYTVLYEPAFKLQESKKWGNNIFGFSSLMQVVG